MSENSIARQQRGASDGQETSPRNPAISLGPALVAQFVVLEVSRTV